MNNDVNTLTFIHERLIAVHGEDPYSDCMISFRTAIRIFELIQELYEHSTRLNIINENLINKYESLVKAMSDLIEIYKQSDSIKTAALEYHFKDIDQCKKVINNHQKEFQIKPSI